VHAAGLARWPELHAAMDGGERVGPVRMLSRWHGFFRESAGPGWALVGDAGHFKDPTPGQGISDALRQSVRLAEAIQAGLERGTEGLDEETARWWAWRDEDAWEMYWFARDMGAPGPTPPLQREIQRRIAADPALTANLVRVLCDHLAPSAAFPPSLALRALARSLATQRGRRRAVLRDAWSMAAAQRSVGRRSSRHSLRPSGSSGGRAAGSSRAPAR
jgi:2-polyprenyl-6-methoxyphenol hydroxylase-like FAD-dependent oxidoreductase